MDSAPKTKPKKSQRLRAIIPMVWELVRPRRALLAIGFGLMVINRVSGLVLPYSTKFLIDTVIVKRHLIGTGLVEFAGGLLTSAIALVVLFRISALMTLLAFAFLLCFAVALNKAFATMRPIFRERGKINAEVTGRLAESLGGVRVIKGYHAEEREEKVFAKGVQRLLDNVMRTLTATSVMSLSASLLMGVVGAVIMFVGARQIMAGAPAIRGCLPAHVV